MSIEAMKEALEAFEHIQGMNWSIVTTATCKRNIANLRQTIEQAEKQEYSKRHSCPHCEREFACNYHQWVGLTDDEIRGIFDCGRGGLIDIKKAEQILKEKNGG